VFILAIKKKASMNKGDLIGGWSFLIGLVLAVILGAMGRVDGSVSTILIVLGLIVGFLNVSDKETNQFLLAGISPLHRCLLLCALLFLKFLSCLGRSASPSFC